MQDKEFSKLYSEYMKKFMELEAQFIVSLRPKALHGRLVVISPYWIMTPTSGGALIFQAKVGIPKIDAMKLAKSEYPRSYLNDILKGTENMVKTLAQQAADMLQWNKE